MQENPINIAIWEQSTSKRFMFKEALGKIPYFCQYVFLGDSEILQSDFTHEDDSFWSKRFPFDSVDVMLVDHCLPAVDGKYILSLFQKYIRNFKVRVLLFSPPEQPLEIVTFGSIDDFTHITKDLSSKSLAETLNHVCFEVEKKRQNIDKLKPSI